jgi:hypothetical protein
LIAKIYLISLIFSLITTPSSGCQGICPSFYTTDPKPTFYGIKDGYLWIYWNNPGADIDIHPYAYYQFPDWSTDSIEFSYYMTDNAGGVWWRTSLKGFCGPVKVYLIDFPNQYIDKLQRVPFLLYQYCTFIPLIGR